MVDSFAEEGRLKRLANANAVLLMEGAGPSNLAPGHQGHLPSEDREYTTQDGFTFYRSTDLTPALRRNMIRENIKSLLGESTDAYSFGFGADDR